MNNYLLVTEKKWHQILFKRLTENSNDSNNKWLLIDKKEDFNEHNLNHIKPLKIFIPHWSYIIDESIYSKYECIVFHMTDLPYGRGGSPLQNLIIRGHNATKISALRVCSGIDTGEIYLKKSLSLEGTAEEIFIRSSSIIYEMIFEILDKELKSISQTGFPVFFKRRKPEEGNLINLKSINEIYNYIRMLDADGYPNAFLEIGNFRLEFTRASLKADEIVIADVRISKK